MTDLEQLKEQICGKEPKKSDPEYSYEDYIRWVIRHNTFCRAVAALGLNQPLQGGAEIEQLADTYAVNHYARLVPHYCGDDPNCLTCLTRQGLRDAVMYGAAAMLELVKGVVPDKMQPRKDDDDIDRANRLGYNDCIREMLTAIQSLQNNDNGKDNQ